MGGNLFLLHIWKPYWWTHKVNIFLIISTRTMKEKSFYRCWEGKTNRYFRRLYWSNLRNGNKKFREITCNIFRVFVIVFINFEEKKILMIHFLNLFNSAGLWSEKYMFFLILIQCLISASKRYMIYAVIWNRHDAWSVPTSGDSNAGLQVGILYIIKLKR